MCGICGELRFDGKTPDMAAIGRMSDKLARRGPDHICGLLIETSHANVRNALGETTIMPRNG